MSLVDIIESVVSVHMLEGMLECGQWGECDEVWREEGGG